MSRFLAAGAVLLTLGCDASIPFVMGSSFDGSHGAEAPDGGPSQPDAAEARDAGSSLDAQGGSDAESPPDAGLPDAGPPFLEWTTPTPSEGSTVSASMRVAGRCESGYPVTLGAAIVSPPSVPCTGDAFDVTVTLGGPDGPVVITAAQTNASNQSSTLTRDLVLDATPPALEWAWCTPLEGATVGPSVDISLTCEPGFPLTSDIAGSVASLGTCPVSGTLSTTLSLPSVAAAVSVHIATTDSVENTRTVSREWIVNPSAVTACNHVFGQPGFTQNTAHPTSSASINTPRGVLRFGQVMVVCDTGNNRVLIWSAHPTEPMTPAAIVLGQPDFSSNTANTGGASARTMAAPADVHTDGTHLVVADRDNHRVLVWSSLPFDPATDQQRPADVVIGQPDFTTTTPNTGGVSGATMDTPTAVRLVAGRLVVSDIRNNRVLIWNTLPTTNGQPADLVLGQADLVGAEANRGGAASSSTLDHPYGIASDGTALLVADMLNDRILIWESFPTVNGAPADVVLGQPDFVSTSSNNGGRSASTLYEPHALSFDGVRLFLADSKNNRVLYWNGIPTENRTPAAGVFGQPDAVTGAPGLDQNRLTTPRFVSSDGAFLFVTDSENHRALLLEMDYVLSAH